MKIQRNSQQTRPVAAIIIFLLSRIIIIFGFSNYLSDVSYYYAISKHAFISGQKAYVDFLYGYPPLSLLGIYLPYQLTRIESSYHVLYRCLYFLFELGTFYYLYRFLKEGLKLARPRIQLGLIFYSLLGLLQGHLIYDRVDGFIILCFMAALYYGSQTTLYPWRAPLAAGLGILWKVIPIFWWPVVTAFSAFRAGYIMTTETKRTKKPVVTVAFSARSWWKTALVCVGIGLLAPALILFVYDRSVDGKMRSMLGIHSERGIQVESLWATPYFILKSYDSTIAVGIANNYGAQHLTGDAVNPNVVAASKSLGFVVMVFFYFTILWRLHSYYKNLLVRMTTDPDHDSSLHLTIALYLCMSFSLILFLTTQRLLSTQFIGWLAPVFAVLVAWKKSIWDTALAFFIFVLTCAGFLGYWQYVEFQPLNVAIVSLRNILLLVTLGRFAFLILVNQFVTKQND